jgi:ferredoxin
MLEQWTLHVDQNRCVGSGTCVGLARRHFVLDRTNHKSAPLSPNIPAEQVVLDAALSCPMEAISIVAAGSGEVIFPKDLSDE